MCRIRVETRRKMQNPLCCPDCKMRKQEALSKKVRRLKFPLEVSEMAGEISTTWGLSKARLQEGKGLKLQVETKCILNT